MIVDVSPTKGIPAEVQLNALIAAAEPSTTIKLHGEFLTYHQILVKKKLGVTLNLDDAIVYQPVMDESVHYGYPILNFAGSKDCSVEGGVIRGSNAELGDGVQRGAEAYAGIKIGLGCENISIHSVTVREVWGDFIWIAGSPHPFHNTKIYIDSVTGIGTGRHAISVRDCEGLNVGHSTFSKIRRLFFDHEPVPGDHFTDCSVHDCTSPVGGLAIWLQIRPVPKSTCGRLEFRDHLLTKGNYKCVIKAGQVQRSGLALAHLKWAPERPPVAPPKNLVAISGWTDVTINDVDGIPVAG